MTSAPRALPGHPPLARRGTELWLEGVRLDDLASTHGTPLFVYSKAAMLSALGAYQRGFAGRQATIHYAMKANSSLGILQLFARAGCGFDLVPGGVLESVFVAGGQDLLFHTSAAAAQNKCFVPGGSSYTIHINSQTH